MTLDRAFEESLMSPAHRLANANSLIETYYDLTTKYYVLGWGLSHHFGVFLNGEDLAEAVVANEIGLAEKAGFAAGMSILDIGCGVGGPALTIASHTRADVTGLDISRTRIELASRNAEKADVPNATFIVGDALSLPFEDDAFDAVYSFEAICHTPDKVRAYSEVARVLRPGGVFTGYDWFQRDDLSGEDVDRYIEPVCRSYAIPYLISPTECTDNLETLRFELDEELTDAAELGDLEPNWHRIEATIALLPGDSTAQQLMKAGGEAICAAARAGAFVLGYWLARSSGSGPSATHATVGGAVPSGSGVIRAGVSDDSDACLGREPGAHASGLTRLLHSNAGVSRSSRNAPRGGNSAGSCPSGAASRSAGPCSRARCPSPGTACRP
jgi:sterol 24-C-methyltransferase